MRAPLETQWPGHGRTSLALCGRADARRPRCSVLRTRAAVELYQGSMPLVGFEGLALALPQPLRAPLLLHTFVLLEAGGGAESWFCDFLPDDPTSPATAARLLTGGAVRGVARCRRLPGTKLPPCSSVTRVCSLSRCDAVAVATAFSEAWDPSLSLAGRNCRHHTDALIAALLHAEAAAGAPG